MATYKVLQDIEAEDKLVGPLSLRQFIYAGVAAVCVYICFLAYSRNAMFLIGIFLPIAGACIFFAFPWKGEQPTEIWALARLRFMVKPRVRVWNQSGQKDLVTIIAPRTKVVPKQNVRNLSQNEVQSRLKALADTIDSRGWATRNANYQYYMNQQRAVGSDRLINASDLKPDAIPMDAFLPANDMLDAQSSVAQNFDTLLNRSTQANRQRVMQQMTQAQMPAVPLAPMMPQVQAPAPMPAAMAPQLPAPVIPAAPAAAYTGVPQPAAPPNEYWFANGPAIAGGVQSAPPPVQNAVPQSVVAPVPQYGPGFGLGPVPASEPTQEEEELARMLAHNNQQNIQINYGHMRVLQPPSNGAGNGDIINYGNLPGSDGIAQATAVAPAPQAPQPDVTRLPNDAIVELAHNNDLDVATLARQAQKEVNKSPDEVEIRLH